MPHDSSLQPRYINSFALVIGINSYVSARPLRYARQDAEGIAGVLQSRFAFPADKITLLLDHDATRDRVASSFLTYRSTTGPDDRLVVFFAGHGYTTRARRGEVGYLVPVDGDASHLASLIRWDELVRNADLIPAKHILFLMDACYGGLMLTRALPAGSARFLRDTLQRHSRQVLTAGKEDEPVADEGGPRPGHSIFTGHLLNGLEGDAPALDGILTANSIMAYVFDRVSRDILSRQSPHYGFLDGDGEFIFAAKDLMDMPAEEEVDSDTLVQIPSSTDGGAVPTAEQSFAAEIKRHLSEPSARIQLDDAVAREIRLSAQELRGETFEASAELTAADFAARLDGYEQVMQRLTTATTLLGRWSEERHRSILDRVPARVADGIMAASGNSVWLDLRWYPVFRLLYAGGIAAVSAGSYRNLATMCLAEVGDRALSPDAGPAILVATDAVRACLEWFRRVPGQERHLEPISEYMYKSLQPPIEDELLLGRSYERVFDRFEVLYALIYADLFERQSNDFWAPSGRFTWKQRRTRGVTTPFDAVVEEATRMGASWGPVDAGLFDGSTSRFQYLASKLRESLVGRAVS
jgi:hypothetical protein